MHYIAEESSCLVKDFESICFELRPTNLTEIFWHSPYTINISSVLDLGRKQESYSCFLGEKLYARSVEKSKVQSECKYREHRLTNAHDSAHYKNYRIRNKDDKTPKVLQSS